MSSSLSEVHLYCRVDLLSLCFYLWFVCSSRGTPPLLSCVSVHNSCTLHTRHRALNAALTFLGLGRIAPEDVLTAVRPGVTVLPGPKTEVSGEVRAFLSADSLARRPRADAMLTAFDAAKNSRYILWSLNSATLRYCDVTPLSLFLIILISLNLSPEIKVEISDTWCSENRFSLFLLRYVKLQLTFKCHNVQQPHILRKKTTT